MLYSGGGESPGYYPNSSTPPQHQKGRPRKRKVGLENDVQCSDMPVTMRMAAATLGKLLFLIYSVVSFSPSHGVCFFKRSLMFSKPTFNTLMLV